MSHHPIELLQLPNQKVRQFTGKGLTSVEDIACFFPRRYIDFRSITSAADAVVGNYCAMQGEIMDIRDGDKTYSLTLQEKNCLPNGYHPVFTVVWFSKPYYASRFTVGKEFIFCGKVSVFRNTVQITSPIEFGEDPSQVCRIYPIYSKIKGMSTEYLTDKINTSIAFLQKAETVGEKELFATYLRLMPKTDALREMHQPTDGQKFRAASRRIAYEDIYDFYEDLKRKDRYLIGSGILPVSKDKQTRALISSLPFPLTPDQAQTVETIIREAMKGNRIHSLISGDVGCGKTIIALIASVLMWENGMQTIVMAPTLVLAQQHFKEFQAATAGMDINIALLTTETKKRERQAMISDFSSGKLDILIGTHAVLNEEIRPMKLGLTIIDEEHKFGVKQKARLEDFDRAGVHHLSMTATPIPRSIAMTVYGHDFAVLPIHTMPAGRKPVITEQIFKSSEAFERIYQEVVAGRQAYIVCPFIEDSDSEKFKNVISATAAQSAAEKYFAKKPERIRVAAINGDMKQQDILDTINAFAAHRIDVLVSTTIVEVGVNVPNASIIAIMSAERFGLAALHQLRGRVGRSSQQGYCLLCSPERSERLDVMCSTTDGFVIAEKDMELRGPGDLVGSAQSGASKVIDTILRYSKLANTVREKIFSAAP